VKYWIGEGYDFLHPDLISAQRAAVAELQKLLDPVEKPNRWHTPGWSTGLFRPKPKHWGLRGDPYLWFELHETLRLVPRPTTTDQFQLYLEVCLQKLVGQDLLRSGERMLQVQRYPLHGMSGGAVCPPKWTDDLAPLLLNRFAERIR